MEIAENREERARDPDHLALVDVASPRAGIGEVLALDVLLRQVKHQAFLASLLEGVEESRNPGMIETAEHLRLAVEQLYDLEVADLAEVERFEDAAGSVLGVGAERRHRVRASPELQVELVALDHRSPIRFQSPPALIAETRRNGSPIPRRTSRRS